MDDALLAGGRERCGQLLGLRDGPFESNRPLQLLTVHQFHHDGVLFDA
jgi:hypothetical protein